MHAPALAEFLASLLSCRRCRSPVCGKISVDASVYLSTQMATSRPQGQVSCRSRHQRESTRRANLFNGDAKVESAPITRRKCGRKSVETNCRERFVPHYRDVLAKDRDDVAHSSTQDSRRAGVRANAGQGVRPAAGHAKLAITTGYLHVVLDRE